MLREDSITESAKQRSLRVPLDHFVRKDWIVRWKFWLAAVAAAIAAMYIAWIFLGGRAGQMQASPGPLAAVHAGWDNDCQVCHQNLKPLRADAVHLTSLGASRASIRESLDQSCIKCHNEPEHHHAAKPDEVMSCSACHRDHLGRMADIVRPADNHCLGCHREINEHRNGQSALAEGTKNVTGFGPIPDGGEGPHPDFRSLGSDPGNIKFNHWLHMQPGAAVAGAKAENKKRLDGLDERFRPQYAKFAKDGGLIELDCSACHETDAGGQYMKPIAYEQHCQACHPLRLSLAEGQGVAEVPHGLTPARLAPAVDGLLIAALQKQQAAARTTDESSANPRIPGRTLGNNLAQEIHRDLRGNAAKAITLQCELCHEARTSGETTAALPDVLPPSIPNRWLRHARFDHTAHRHVSCKECHEAAHSFLERDKPRMLKPGGDQMLADDSEKVMIARLNDCAKCHNSTLAKAGGARHDCAECHNYHDRDKVFGAKPASLTASAAKRVQAGIPAGVPAGFRVQDQASEVSPTPALLDLRLVSFNSLPAGSSPVVGASSCASVGCHGDVRPNAPAWQTSLTKFFASDPHAQAYDVLWTQRGREMTRLLAIPGTTDEEPLSDAAHFRVVQERCIGCHATPLPDGAAAGENSYVLGVHCESCHGAAGGWLHSHYQTGFENESVRSAAPGFADTKKLDSRAAACMKCHVGPSDAAGSPQVVDHDLIAAGHPRLAFEFHSYFQSLPEHWNRQADEAKAPGAFHFRSWLAGQAQVAKHKEAIAKERPLDFSNLDCFACHHSLAPDSWRQPARFDSLKAVPWPSSPLPSANSDSSINDRLVLAHALVENAQADGRFDAAVQSYLATRAIASDIRPAQGTPFASELSALDSALNSLATYLADTSFTGRHSTGRQPTPYDSPTDFAPLTLTERTKKVLDVVQRLEVSTRLP